MKGLKKYVKKHGKPFYKTRHNYVKFALCIVEEYALHGGVMFTKWIRNTKDFDFTPYI